MKEVLQHVKEVLERTFDQPNSSELDQCITELQQALETSGDKGKMIEDVIRSIEQARNAQIELKVSGDSSSTNAFGEAYRAIDQAIESYS
jgi:hypothetical protein